MSRECKLIGTLPKLHDEANVHDMLSSNAISEVRYNSGVNNLLSEKEIVERLKQLQDQYNKTIWIDLKGRQLRVNAWADARFDVVELNHDVDIEYPAKIVFRGGHEAEIKYTRGNKIVLTDFPSQVVGKGQSVNVFAKSLEIKGYLTDQDERLIEESAKVGMNHYMASFVEKEDDLMDILRLNKDAVIVSKIESVKGLDFIRNARFKLNLMAARDDLYIETSQNIQMLKYLREIIEKDKEAICASRIFSSLNGSDKVSLSDYEDLELMYLYGYRNFMLADDVKGPKLRRSLEAWGEFINE